MDDKLQAPYRYVNGYYYILIGSIIFKKLNDKSGCCYNCDMRMNSRLCRYRLISEYSKCLCEFMPGQYKEVMDLNLFMLIHFRYAD